MEKNEITEYFDNALIPKLKALKVSENYIIEIVEDIKKQIYSLLKHWNDFKFRETILFLGMEEGYFYKPREASIKVKCFVVVTIRNSLLETIASVDYEKAGLEKYISDEDIIDITMNAIKYFDSINLRKVSEKLDYSNCDDIYFKITNKYKMAWKALQELCGCVGQEKSYDKIKEYNKIYIDDLKHLRKEKIKDISRHIDYQSGISPEFSDELISIINNIINKTQMKFFFSDCFKYTTRNIEKLMQILEILLQNNRIFLSSNYYISNNYVAKRKKILRASHEEGEEEYKIRQLGDVSKIHAQALKEIGELYYRGG